MGAFTYWHRVKWHSKNNGGDRYVKGQLVGMDRKMEEINTILLQPKKKGFKLITVARFEYLGRLPRDATYQEVDKKFGTVGVH